MAASMRCSVTFMSRRISSFKFRVSALHTSCDLRQSSLPYADNEEVVYPPIKPKYPPGEWGKIRPKDAWTIHDEAQELLKIPNVKMRLENIAGPYDGKKPVLYDVKLIDPMPNTVNFKQYATKTHIVEGLPDVYDGIDKRAIETATKQLNPLLEDAILHEVDQRYTLLDRKIVKTSERFYFGVKMIDRILSVVQAGLAHSVPHLHRSQWGSDVRVETFWKRGGYDGDFHVHRAKCGGIINYWTKFRAANQVRTEMPLPEVLPIEDELCQTGAIPDYRFGPKTAGQRFTEDRPLTISGHWVGDPCEFHHLSAIVPHMGYERYMEASEDNNLDRDTLSWGVTAGFGSTVSQSFNQGFFPWLDITYPLVSQVLITDGQWFRFFVYQLNTIHLWKDDVANPTRNIMWASPRMKLYESVEGSKVIGLNEEVFSQLIKCLLLEPQDRGIDLRPYLPNEAAPGLTNKFINNVGEEPLPQHKIGRFEYPRNAVYF